MCFSTTKTRCARVLLLALYVLIHQPLVGAEPEQAQPSTPSSYDKLAETYLPSLVKEAQVEKLSEEERQKKINALLRKKGSKGVLKESNLNAPAVGEIEKLELIYNLMHKHAQSCPTLTNNVVHDLEIFCGGPSDLKDHVFGAIDHTTTAFGKIELQRMLLEPKTDIAELRARQDIIKTLIKNPALVKKIEASLQRIKAAESELLWFWKQMDETTEQFFDQVYFGKTLGINFSGLNTNSTATNTAAMWTEFGSTLWWSVGLPLCLAAAAELWFIHLRKQHNYNYEALPQEVKTFVETVKGLSPTSDNDKAYQQLAYGRPYPDRDEDASLMKIKRIFSNIPNASLPSVAAALQDPSLLKIYKTIFIVAFDFYTKWFPNFCRTDEEIPSIIKAILGGFIFTPLLICCILLKGNISSARHFNAVSNIIHAKMIKAASYFDATGELIKIMSTDKALSKMLVNTTAQAKARSPEQEAQLKELLRLMDTSTLHSNPSFFSIKGRPLAAFKLMQNTKNEFAGVLQLAGKLDAYLSLAKLYCSNPWGRYCFVDYVTNSATPYLKIDDFWHPMLNPNKVVANSIELGATSGARNAVITGPNAGGKSTALKSIVLAIIMAQTLGIAPARSMTLTPFVQTGAYLNIADAIGKESLYQAEMNRAQALLNSINALKPGEFSFVIMDEIFTGTNHEEGSAGAFGIATCLASLSQNMCLIATHYKQLTELEKAADHSFKNYKVSVVIHPDGKITPTYILDAGIADQKIALQLLTNAGFNSKVLQAAQDAMNSQKSLPAA
jgi:hypothetical protein